MAVKKSLNVRCSRCDCEFDFYSPQEYSAVYLRSKRSFLCDGCGRLQLAHKSANYQLLFSKEMNLAPAAARGLSTMFIFISLALLTVAALIYLGYVPDMEFPFLIFGVVAGIGAAAVRYLAHSTDKAIEEDFGSITDL